jgi:ATP-dependent protease ClpP protease subunit
MDCTNNTDAEQIPVPYRYYDTVVTAKTHHFYISEGVGAPNEYTDMIHQIKTAGPHDVVYIYLNTPGGRLDTGVQLINAMRCSPAHVITVLESQAHSLGTMLFLAGNEYIVHEHSRMMFHNFTSGTYGKGNEQMAELQSTVQWFNDLGEDIYVPFLSQQEFEEMQNGRDIWMDAPEIQERLSNMVEILQEEVAAEDLAETIRVRDETKQTLDQLNAAIKELQPARPKKKAVAKKKASKKKAAAKVADDEQRS